MMRRVTLGPGVPCTACSAGTAVTVNLPTADGDPSSSRARGKLNAYQPPPLPTPPHILPTPPSPHPPHRRASLSRPASRRGPSFACRPGLPQSLPRRARPVVAVAVVVVVAVVEVVVVVVVVVLAAAATAVVVVTSGGGGGIMDSGGSGQRWRRKWQFK